MSSDVRADEQPRPTEPPQPGAPARRRARMRAVLVPAALVGVALALRLVGLDEPARMYFDEVYYAEDARQLLARGVEEGFVVHPPLGKWLIAIGLGVVDAEPLGWRLPSAVAGSLLVLVTYALGLRLLGRRGLAALAALLVAVDGIALTSSRIAMLEPFLALFVTAAAWALLVDAEHRDAGPARHEDRPPLRPTSARWLAGGLLGLAVATKWSGLLAIGVAGLVVLVGDLLWRRRLTGRWLPDPARALLAILLPLVVLPALIYLASYAPWFANYEQTRPGGQACQTTPCEVSPPERLAGWWGEQRAILAFHTSLDVEHDYRAPAWTWPLLTRPVVYYFESCEAEGGEDCVVPAGQAELILGVGNPAVWWPALAAYALLAWAAVARRSGTAWFLLAFLLGQWLPWLLAGRPVFLFYTAPIVPFIALSLAWAAGQARGRVGWWWLPGALAVVAVVGLWVWFPVWVGEPLDDAAWRARMLFESWY